jgi:putative hemolysin
VDSELILFGLLAIPILIAINGFFVAVEFALVAIRKTRVEELVRQGVRGATSLEAARNDLDKSIAAAQLGITLASIALGAVGESVLAQLLAPLFGFIPPQLAFISKHTFATLLSVGIITFLHVILGEQVPKMMAIQTADRVALWSSRSLIVFAKLTSPVLKLMNAVGNGLLRMLGYTPGNEHESTHSIDELRMIVEDTQQAGLLEANQAALVQNVFKMTEKKVRDCMIPIDKMDAIELHMKPAKVLEIVRKCGHTRLPVYEANRDNIVGILNTKNLFYFLSLANVVVLEDALYPAEFIDADVLISKALHMFRRTRRPMAIVREKDGSILGLITLEDVVEEIVGDIEDEHDEVNKPSSNSPPPSAG